MDTLLTLYNNSGNRIASDDDSGDGYNARITGILNSGRYYIEVRNYDKNTGECILGAQVPAIIKKIIKAITPWPAPT